MGPVILALLALAALSALLVLRVLLVDRGLRALRAKLDLVDQQARRVQADLVDLRGTLERVIADLTAPVTPAPEGTPVRGTARGDRKERTSK